MFPGGMGKLCLAVIGTGGSVAVVCTTYLLENYDTAVMV
jgi:hypothetical protein